MKWNPFGRSVRNGFSDDMLIALAMGDILPGAKTSVSQDNALTSNAVLACLIVRAETFASLPAHVYRANGDARERQSGHPVEVLASGYANPLMTSAEFLRWKQFTEDIRGNAYARVEWRGNTAVALWPMTNPDVKAKYSTHGGLAYEYAGDTLTPAKTYGAREILHFKGPVLKDAWTGTSLVTLAAESIGLSIDAEKFYHRLLQNGSHFPGYLQTDSSLDEQSVAALAAQFDAKKGVENAGKIKIFDRGLKWVSNPMTMKDADIGAQQLWQLQQVCRVFRVPPPLVQDWSRSTYTNSEQADLWFAKHTITPIAVNTEKVMGRLFRETGEDKRGYYLKFELDGLLRGDYKTRAEGYAVLINAGVMLRNEARRLEDMNPIEGLDKPLVPLNMGIIGADGELERDEFADSPSQPTRGDGEEYPGRDEPPAPLLEDAENRIRTRAEQDAERGRDYTTTLDFALRVLEPIAASFPAFDAHSFAATCLGKDAV